MTCCFCCADYKMCNVSVAIPHNNQNTQKHCPSRFQRQQQHNVAEHADRKDCMRPPPLLSPSRFCSIINTVSRPKTKKVINHPEPGQNHIQDQCVYWQIPTWLFCCISICLKALPGDGGTGWTTIVAALVWGLS